MLILLTGGAGYIGSHTCVELLKAGHQAVIYDNLSNGCPEVLDRIAQIEGQMPIFVQGDVRDSALVAQTLLQYGCEAVIHFAGLKAVDESVKKPLEYYSNNVTGTLSVAEAMRLARVPYIVFSSSAAVYGVTQRLPLTEDLPLSPANPYGRTKLIGEELLLDFVKAFPSHCVGILRYFGAVGAHESGLIGDAPKNIPDNLFPYITQTAVGLRESLTIWGNDYDTPDGTGVRDYVHVTDIARGHVNALEALVRKRENFTVNFGAGRGYSVLEVVRTFERVSGQKIPYAFGPRREGDIAASYADTRRAKTLLGWTAERNLEQMCADAWNWQLKNPEGYR
jgi:UDP-glucose 4-epimerase